MCYGYPAASTDRSTIRCAGVGTGAPHHAEVCIPDLPATIRVYEQQLGEVKQQD